LNFLEIYTVKPVLTTCTPRFGARERVACVEPAVGARPRGLRPSVTSSRAPSDVVHPCHVGCRNHLAPLVLAAPLSAPFFPSTRTPPPCLGVQPLSILACCTSRRPALPWSRRQAPTASKRWSSSSHCVPRLTQQRRQAAAATPWPPPCQAPASSRLPRRVSSPSATPTPRQAPRAVSLPLRTLIRRSLARRGRRRRSPPEPPAGAAPTPNELEIQAKVDPSTFPRTAPT
jgi:hypothetical protein